MSRDLVRLLIVAVLVFFVIGFAMIYSRDSAFRHGVSAFISGSTGAIGRGFSDLTGIGNNAPPLEKTTLRILRPNQSSWMGLNSFPDETVVHFPLPHVGGYMDGYLDLRFDVQLAQSGDGLMTIRVNGERRHQVVLDKGHRTYNISVPLTQTDLLGDRVVLELTGRGTTNSGQICPSDSANFGVAITLLPESAMVLNSMRDIRDPDTTLISLPDPLRIYLGQDLHAQIMSIWTSHRMIRAGVPSLLTDDAVTPGRLIATSLERDPVELDVDGNVLLNGERGIDRAIAYHAADKHSPIISTGWPISVSMLTTETMTRNFRGSKRWFIPYRVSQLPGGLTPTNFDLALRTSVLPADSEWVVRLSLNGNLIKTSRQPGNQQDIRIPVELPTHLQGIDNLLLVELVDTTPNKSICRAAPDAQAQLLPESQLTAHGKQPETGWGAVIRRIAAAHRVSPGSHGLLDVSQATRVATMLSQFLPADANVVLEPEGTGVTLTVLDKERFSKLLYTGGAEMRLDRREAWLITTSGGTAINPLGLYNLRVADHQHLLDQMHPTSVVILARVPTSD